MHFMFGPWAGHGVDPGRLAAEGPYAAANLVSCEMWTSLVRILEALRRGSSASYIEDLADDGGCAGSLQVATPLLAIVFHLHDERLAVHKAPVHKPGHNSCARAGRNRRLLQALRDGLWNFIDVGVG